MKEEIKAGGVLLTSVSSHFGSKCEELSKLWPLCSLQVSCEGSAGSVGQRASWWLFFIGTPHIT